MGPKTYGYYFQGSWVIIDNRDNVFFDEELFEYMNEQFQHISKQKEFKAS